MTGITGITGITGATGATGPEGSLVLDQRILEADAFSMNNNLMLENINGTEYLVLPSTINSELGLCKVSQ